jgi:hypothetical protein
MPFMTVTHTGLTVRWQHDWTTVGKVGPLAHWRRYNVPTWCVVCRSAMNTSHYTSRVCTVLTVFASVCSTTVLNLECILLFLCPLILQDNNYKSVKCKNKLNLRWLSWVIAPCNVIDVYRRFIGAYWLHLQDSESWALRMEAADPSETSVNFYHVTRGNNHEDSHLRIRRRENRVTEWI